MLRKSLVCLLAAFAVAALASAQTADELIEKNIQAKGGLEKIKAVQSMRMTGKIVGGGMETPIRWSSRAPTGCAWSSPSRA